MLRPALARKGGLSAQEEGGFSKPPRLHPWWEGSCTPASTRVGRLRSASFGEQEATTTAALGNEMGKFRADSRFMCSKCLISIISSHTRAPQAGKRHARGWVRASGQRLQKVLIASPARSRQPPARPRLAGLRSRRPSMSVRLSRALLAPHFQAATAVVSALLTLGVLLPTAAFPCGAPHRDNATASTVGEPRGGCPTPALGGALPSVTVPWERGKPASLPPPPGTSAEVPSTTHLPQKGSLCFPKHLELPPFAGGPSAR